MPQRRLSILLVDDDVLLCRGLVRALHQEGFDVHAVHSATEAVSHFENTPIDIVLLDWILPDRDGVTVLQDLRERGNLVPIIMLSGESSIQGRVRALNRGADDYLPKPFATEELIARIHANVRRHSGMFTVSHIGRISVDTWKQEVSVDGSRVDLTPIEFAILKCLARTPDEVIPRKQIVDAVWTNRGIEGSSKALDLQLMRLRRKLGAAADQIEVVRGSGVRLSGSNGAAD
jgi:DNA-binding response OmpR family regulator